VPVPEVMRFAMYAQHYGRERTAMGHYARLDPAQRADHCATCAAPCEARCRFEIPIRSKLMRADERLRWC